MTDAPMPDWALATAPLRSGYAYWDAKRAGRPMPARADLNPVEIKPLLPHVILIDVLRAPLDFRYRLIGSLIDDHSLARYTGKRFSELPHQREPSQLWRNLREVAETAKPCLHRVPYVGPHRDFLSVLDIVMPLSTDGSTVDMLFAVVDFVPRERTIITP